MQVNQIPEGLFTALDDATQGILSQVRQYCVQQELDLDISTLTFLDGLPDRQMKLTVLATRQGQTIIWSQADMVDQARLLGWNLYLYEQLGRARGALARAHQNLDRLAEPAGPGLTH